MNLKCRYFVRENTDDYILIEDISHNKNQTIFTETKELIQHLFDTGTIDEYTDVYAMDMNGEIVKLEHIDGNFTNIKEHYNSLRDFLKRNI